MLTRKILLIHLLLVLSAIICNAQKSYYISKIQNKQNIEFKDNLIIDDNTIEIEIIINEPIQKLKIEDFKNLSGKKGLTFGKNQIISRSQNIEINGDFMIKTLPNNKEYNFTFINKRNVPITPKPPTTPEPSKNDPPLEQDIPRFKHGKNLLQDAKVLNDKPTDDSIKRKLLKTYNAKNDDIFLTSIVIGGEEHNNAIISGYSNNSNIAKTDVTNFATGMARFLAERAKAELSESFFFYMHKQMDQYPDLKFYFPNSYKSLAELKNYNQNLDLEHLKNNFEQDIHRLPKNLYLTTQRTNLSPSSHLYTINNYFKNNSNGQWVDYSLQAVFENDGRINPKDLLYNFVHSDARKSFEEKLIKTNNQASLNVLNSIKLAELVSNSLLSPETNRYWVSKDEINNLIEDDKLFKTYIGLLLAKSNFDEYQIKFGGKSLKDITEDNYNKYQNYKYAINFLKNFKTFDDYLFKIINGENINEIEGLNNLSYTIINSENLKNLINKKIKYLTNNNRVKKLEENITKLKENNSLKTEINSLKTEINSLKTEIDEEILTVENEIKKLNIDSLLKKYSSSNEIKFYDQLKILVENIYNSYDEVDNAANILKSDKNNLSTESLYKMYNVLNKNITTITTQVDDLNLFNQKISFDDASFTNYIQPSIDIAYNMSAKKYNIAIKKFITIINSASEKQDIQNFENIFENEQLTKALMVKYYSKTDNIKELIKDFEIKDPKSIYIEKESQILISNEINKRYNQICEDNKNNKKFHKHIKEHHKEYDTFLSKFNTYGTLIANVALAQNSTEVKDAISASVLPVGSSRVKRNSNWSVTMNAFVGGFAGKAYYKEFVDDVAVKKSITSFGIIAPIGISINKGNLKMFNSNTALGLTLQVIDLGSLVNFYVQKGDGAELPNNSKIELGDIIAPGAMLSYSLGDSPFTILGGIQYVPNLSRMESIPTNKDFKPLTWRMHFGIAIDIPLFNLKVWN